MNIKNIVTKKRIIGLILIVSLGANVYWFGNQFWQTEKQKNFNQGVIFVFQTAQQNGSVQMTINGEIIKLIKE